MDKNEAFEVVVSIVSQVNSFNLVQARAVEEAIQVLVKELDYKPSQETKDGEAEDLEKPKKK